MQLSEKITNPEDLLKVEDYDIEHSAFMQECEVLFGPLSDDTFWKYREHLRSTYVYTPINIKGKPFHFVHLNKDDPNLIAFTANDKIGKKDGKTFIKPGKYLAQYSSLDNEQIKTVVTNYKHEFVPPELFYATSADDAARIYEEGPNSCMRGKGWDIENHPVRIYYGPDTRLAYIKNKTGKGISARCLIRIDKTPHEYTTIYGDKALMEKAFKAAEIVPAREGMKGCRFPLLWYKNNEQKKFMMPYIDGGISNAWVSKKRDRREYMIIGKLPTTDGEMYWQLSSTPTSGYQIMPDVRECSNCSELEFQEKLIIVDGASYCEKCSEGLDVIIINKGCKNYEKRILRRTAERNSDSYFEIDNLWYSRNGLHAINKFYDNENNIVIPLEDTEICSKSGDRYAKVNMLLLHSVSNRTKFFMRCNASNLTDNRKHIDKNTYEFYSEKLALKLITEGSTTLQPVRTFLEERLEEMKANIIDEQNYIPPLVEALEVREGIKEFLKLYLEYVNSGSSYL